MSKHEAMVRFVKEKVEGLSFNFSPERPASISFLTNYSQRNAACLSWSYSGRNGYTAYPASPGSVVPKRKSGQIHVDSKQIERIHRRRLT